MKSRRIWLRSRQACVNKQQAPTRRNIRMVGFALSESPDEVYECHDHYGDQRCSPGPSGSSPMVSEAKTRPLTRPNIPGRSLGGKRQRECSKRGLAIKSCAPHGSAAVQKVSDQVPIEKIVYIENRTALSGCPAKAKPGVSRRSSRTSTRVTFRVWKRIPTSRIAQRTGVGEGKASGTTLISAGRLPIGSPSAST